MPSQPLPSHADLLSGDYPSVDPVLMNRTGGVSGHRMCAEYEIPGHSRAQQIVRIGFERDDLSWAMLAVERLSAAVEEAATHGDKAAHDKVIDLAEIACEWAKSISRRLGQESDR